MFKLPFSWMPGAWGLKGKTREIAQAEYELTGEALEFKLLGISKPEIGDRAYLRQYTELEYKYGHIKIMHYKRALADLIEDPVLKEKQLLSLDKDEGKITEMAYAKQLATLNNEPWVTVVNMDFATKSSLEGSFELDWNEQFVKKLELEGYKGPTPDNIVNQWFMEVCRNIAMEEFDGTGDFTSDSAANLETMKRWSSSESLPEGKKKYR